MGWPQSRSGSIKALVGVSCLHDRQLLYLSWRGETFPHARQWWCPRPVLAPRVMAHVPVRAGGWSCEAETCRARRRLVVGIPFVGNWSEMQPTGRRLDVLPVWVLTRVLSPPRLESWPWHCQFWPSLCQWCWVTLCSGKIFSPWKRVLICDLVKNVLRR
jgi:hypothetical protein